MIWRLVRAGFALALCASLVASVGCDDEGENYLDGSLTDGYDLDFDGTRARLYTSELSIEYTVDSAQGEKIALRLALAVQEQPFATGVAYDIKAIGSISRGAGFGSPLPELESAEIEFSEIGAEDGSDVAGEFTAVFVADDGSKLSLRGGFAAKLEVVPG